MEYRDQSPVSYSSTISSSVVSPSSRSEEALSSPVREEYIHSPFSESMNPLRTRSSGASEYST